MTWRKERGLAEDIVLHEIIRTKVVTSGQGQLNICEESLWRSSKGEPTAAEGEHKRKEHPGQTHCSGMKML